jgi:hypothetical protein
MVHAKKFFPNYPENPVFEKGRFSGPFRQNLLSYSVIALMLFRTLPVAPGCNKVSENEKTSGNPSIREVFTAKTALSRLDTSPPEQNAPTESCEGCPIPQIRENSN